MTCMIKNWKDRQHLPTDYSCGEHEQYVSPLTLPGRVSIKARNEVVLTDKSVCFDDHAVP